MKQIHLIVGARPNFIKVAPLMREMQYTDIKPVIVHTGQHYDYEMSQIFFEELEIPRPDFYLGIGSGSHGQQTGKIMISYDKLLDKNPADMIIVLGDVNSTLACALVGAKRHIPIAHIEAGLRSYDMSMPEEVNRVLCDHISDLLFITEQSGIDNLQKEGVEKEKCHLIGNVMIDELRFNLPKIQGYDITKILGENIGSYSLMTLHRPVNVDSSQSLKKALEIIEYVSHKKKIIFPMHPRTKASLERHDLLQRAESIDALKIVEPKGFLSFMALLVNADFVMTDSGGIQSEAAFLKVPCITLRETTEHRITLEHNVNRLTKFDIDDVSEAIDWAKSIGKEINGDIFPKDITRKIIDRISQFLSESETR